MKNPKLNERIYSILALLSCMILVPCTISASLLDFIIIDLNKGGIFVLWTIITIIQYYRFKLINLTNSQTTS